MSTKQLNRFQVSNLAIATKNFATKKMHLVSGFEKRDRRKKVEEST